MVESRKQAADRGRLNARIHKCDDMSVRAERVPAARLRRKAPNRRRTRSHSMVLASPFACSWLHRRGDWLSPMQADR